MFSTYFALWFGYLAILLIFGLLLKKRVRNVDDFFFASRKLKASPMSFSLAASWIGATSILVVTDEACRQGLGSLWLVGIPAWLTVVLMAIALAKPMRRSSGFALQELLEARYGSAMRRLASLVIFWYLLMLAASQLVALGTFLKLFLQRDYYFSLIIGLLAVLIYTSLGGLISVVTNDLFQSFFLLTGLMILFLTLLIKINNLGGLAQLEASFWPYLGLFSNIKKNSLMALSFTLAWLISPIAWQRVHAAQNLVTARKGLWLTSIIFAIIYPIISFLGILGRRFYEPENEGSPLLAWLIMNGPIANWLKGLLFIAIVAAILSTLDTAINSSCLFLSREIIGLSQRNFLTQPLRFSRLTNLAVGFLAFLVATQFRNILQTIGLASEIMAEGLFIPVVAMFFLRGQAKLAGLLSLSLGTFFSLGSFLSGAGFIKVTWPTWPVSLPYGLALSLFGFGLGLLMAKLWKNKTTQIDDHK
ncbi:MAG: sodium:solute symporter family protein [Candidatus Aminicenantes bacterium]|nr:sodium:solute symporter family protein [Candidatus Aminicenantes bacterium]